MQGFNMGRYVPPELEGTVSGNQLQRKRAPGTLRADGTQTVRFEMPFAVWCHGCTPHEIIGQGVRFNAVKRKVGLYLSTPIWSFSLKHVACGATIEIRTDPQHTAYVVVSGGKARDYGEAGQQDVVREGEAGVPILTAEERARRREDAFAELEGKTQDRDASTAYARRIAELHQDRARDWDDPFAANRRVRASFRRERKQRQREESATEALKQRLGTNMDILPEEPEDARRAKLVAYGTAAEHDVESGRASASTRPFLREPIRAATPRSEPRSTKKANSKQSLQRQLLANTRAAMNPFGGTEKGFGRSSS